MDGRSPSPQGSVGATDAGPVAEFAAALRELRAGAGTPSFRELAGRSRAISHTTLHEAAQGLRLPSWSTTVEFVKACGGDPAAYRARWEQADEAVRAARAGCAEPAAPPVDAAPVEPTAVEATSVETAAVGATAVDAAPVVEPEPAPEPEPEPEAVADGSNPPPRSRRTRTLLGVGAAAVVVTAVALTVALVHGRGDGTTPSAVTSPLGQADCPVQQTNPPPVEPATAGDASAFIADITLPDCSEVPADSTVTKTWRFKNTGTVTWTGYSLHRVDLPETRDQCQTIEDIPLDDTAPGEIVDVSTVITTPRQPIFCFVRFKLEDAQGRVAFPGSRPVNFQIVVVG